jgi:DmsE family decaheme c-type cytochrome
MSRRFAYFFTRSLGITLLVTWVAAVRLAAGGAGLSASTQAGTTAPASASPPAAQAGGFVGEATCTTCHDAEGKSLAMTLHGKARNERTPAATGHACETCHGPGQAHVGDPTKIRRFTAIQPREASAICLTCHDRKVNANFRSSMHDARNLSCVTCHSIHSPKSEYYQLKTNSVIETCAGCHKTEVAKLQRLGHMPLREGKMDCGSCHNPHGSTNVRMLNYGNSVNELCLKCHTERRGPFLWDHAPVREGCNTCHDPHGSNNQWMLVSKLPMLCQRCHIGTRHPSTIYDANQLAARSNRLINRSCVNCHAQIHGSNSPAGNAFLR